MNHNSIPIKTQEKTFIDLTKIFPCCRPTVIFHQVPLDFFQKTIICWEVLDDQVPANLACITQNVSKSNALHMNEHVFRIACVEDKEIKLFMFFHPK